MSGFRVVAIYVSWEAEGGYHGVFGAWDLYLLIVAVNDVEDPPVEYC